MSQTANIIDVNEATFERDVIQKSFEKPVVVDFWAARCGPCRMLGPILERLATAPGSSFTLAKVDVDANPGLSMRFGVRGIPAVKAFRDGKVAGEFVGAQPEPRVRQFIEQLAPANGGPAAVTAEQLLAERRWAEAETLFRERLVDDPFNPQAQVGLVKALLGQGKGCEARQRLEDMLDVSATMAKAERLMPLADYLCAAAERVDDNDEVTLIEAQYRQSARLLNRGKWAPGMDGLLDVLRANKNYRDGQVRGAMLGLFELLGDDDPLTTVYRREMASTLF